MDARPLKLDETARMNTTSITSGVNLALGRVDLYYILFDIKNSRYFPPCKHDFYMIINRTLSTPRSTDQRIHSMLAFGYT